MNKSLLLRGLGRIIYAGADLGFSRGVRGGGGADFQNVRNFFRPFFLGRPIHRIDFPSYTTGIKLKRPCFGQIFCAAG